MAVWQSRSLLAGSWRLEAETLPIPNSGSLGSQTDWGYGTLTNGERRLVYVYRGASPWTSEECLQTLLAGSSQSPEKTSSGWKVPGSSLS